MISNMPSTMGPEIHHAHRPGERVNIPSIVEFYTLLCEVVRRLATWKITASL